MEAPQEVVAKVHEAEVEIRRAEEDAPRNLFENAFAGSENRLYIYFKVTARLAPPAG